jgi:hypothetical protein
MPRTMQSGRQRAERRRRAIRRNSPRLSLESDLSRVLISIATLLISSGYAYGRLSRLARSSFVDAAISMCEAEGRKASVAQLAASTGLSRTEVSNILRRRRVSPPDVISRAASVAQGWLSDSEFLDSRDLPRPLAFKGGGGDFTTLAKRFSGDIPARAMLREMERLKMVVRDHSGALRLIRPSAEITKANVRAMRAIAPWVHMLKDSIQDAKARLLSSNTNQLDLNFDSIPQMLAVLGELRKRRRAFVQGVSELGIGKRRTKYSLRITVAVAVARPRRRVA